MKNTFRNTVIASLVALGGFAAAPSAAQADALYFQFGVAPGGYHHYDHDRYDRYVVRDERHGRRCTPERALDKAQDLGFRRVELERVGRNRIVVSGRKHGERRDVVFARERGCPVIRIR